MIIEAYHLPGLADPPSTSWEYGQGDERLDLRIAQLTPELLRRQVDALVEAREHHLVRRPIADIVHVIDQVAARLLDPDDDLRRTAEAALPLVTGSSTAMVRRVLDGMAADWRRTQIESLLTGEFGDPAVLDGWVRSRRREGRSRMRAIGPRLACHFFSGNIPGIAVTSLIRSLLVKAATLGKTAVGDPVLPALFARALHEVDEELGRCIAVTYWPGGDEPLERVALESSDAVVVYGAEEAIASVRGRVAAGARFLGYGHKLSFGAVARESLDPESAAAELARAAALEVATFDQHGCVSPHLFYVEKGGAVSPERWAELVARSLAELETELPRGALSPGEVAAIRQLRGAAEFAQISGSGAVLHASPTGTAWTVVYETDPAFEASCLNRVVRIKPVDELGDVVALATPVGPFLQTVGMAGPPERVAPVGERLAMAGASRIADIGQMSWPRPTWHHDGRPPLLDLVRWCDWDDP